MVDTVVAKVVEANEAQTERLRDGGGAGVDARTSIVDTVFDSLGARAARGLVAAKDVLEGVARWLDARAKVAGELAELLSSSGTSAGTSTDGR